MADRLALSGLAVTDVDASEAFHPYTKGRIGFKLPYWRPDGTPHPLMHRVRLEAPVGGKYTQPSKEEFKAAGLPETDATHPYLNPNILHGAKWEDIAKQQKTLLVVEGELKAACAGKHLLLPAIGIGGCANATFADPTTGVHQLHPVIASLLQPGDTLEIALDGDIFTNPNVNRSAGTLRRVLTRMGYDCRFVILPGARVNGPRQGVDDWIMAQPAANRRQAFDALERIDGSDGEFDEDSETLWDYLGLKLTAKGVPWGNHTNVKVLLSKHERYVNKFYYDEATCKIMHTLWDKPKELTDDFVVHEIAWIQKHINVHHWSPTPITASLYSLSVYRRLCRNTLHDDIEAEK
jgi:hypothetical protein